jgi:hypothetical protein
VAVSLHRLSPRRRKHEDHGEKRRVGKPQRRLSAYTIPEIEKVKMLDMEDFNDKGFAEKKKEYQKIFMR